MGDIRKNFHLILLILSFVGIVDSVYLTYEHYAPSSHIICPEFSIIDCGKVIKGPYSEIYAIPLSILGLIFYLFFFVLIFLIKKYQVRVFKYFAILSSSFAFLFSIYLVYLQLFVIGAICIYCMLSALTSTSLFIISLNYFEEERKGLVAIKVGWLYRNIFKKMFFMIDAEIVHENMLSFGELSGRSNLIKKITEFFFLHNDKILSQKIVDINFERPIGLAAGFDYEAKLTQFLPSLGFGFATVGTITNLPYGGNPKPRLGRLPNSKSLLVNKGFKNEGAEEIAKKMSNFSFEYPQGVSIGRSNNEKLDSQKKSVDDVVSAFKTFEKNKVGNKYYELNISCPNLIHGNVDFYNPNNLDELLSKVGNLKIKKPILIKMPIEKSDREVLAMLKVIVKHKIAGVIFGNLQKDRKHKSLVKEEVNKFKMGFFSGKPTFERSNELIKLAYKKFGKKLVIIGCGGVFSAEDAYTKIKLGASLIQLITGLIYQGPQLVSEINLGLLDLLKKDEYKNISEAEGVDSK